MKAFGEGYKEGARQQRNSDSKHYGSLNQQIHNDGVAEGKAIAIRDVQPYIQSLVDRINFLQGRGIPQGAHK
jgi:hypothetical protein